MLLVGQLRDWMGEKMIRRLSGVINQSVVLHKKEGISICMFANGLLFANWNPDEGIK